MKRFTRTAMVSLCLALLLCAGIPAGAQTVQTLTIDNGKVIINGQEVAVKDLPDTVDLRDYDATYSFSGDVRPLIKLGDAFYLYDGQFLRPFTNLQGEEGGLFVFLDASGEATTLLGRYGNTVDQYSFNSVAQQQAQALQQYTQELQQLSSQKVDQRQANQALVTARERMAQAAQVVQALPRLQVQSYLNETQQYDQNLYSLLVREWRMEREAEALAIEIRRLPDGESRTLRIDQLHRKLDEIFELKQQNRRREIGQLEQELEALRERLQKREAWRDRLIQQRLSELIGVQVQLPPDNR